MARPSKKGLGYFPLDTDFLSDRKIRRLSQSHGCQGIATYLAILCEVYGTTGYYTRYSEDFCFDIGFNLNVEEEQVRKIIASCVEIRLFDRDLFENHQILSSRGIQSRYREVGKRGVSCVCDEWVLPEQADEGVSVAETPVIVAETPVSVTETSISVAETPLKGKGKGKGKETQLITKKQAKNEKRNSKDRGESVRRAELLQMAADATSVV